MKYRCTLYAMRFRQMQNKRTSLRGAGDEAISCNKEQIASLRSQ
ncbi:MAG: hypothetical protein ACK5IQ_07575 [Bacteroidales bacterium]